MQCVPLCCKISILFLIVTNKNERPMVSKCRAVASVVLNDPDKIEPVLVTVENRFDTLNNRDIDILVRGDAYTLERELREVSVLFQAIH